MKTPEETRREQLLREKKELLRKRQVLSDAEAILEEMGKEEGTAVEPKEVKTKETLHEQKENLTELGKKISSAENLDELSDALLSVHSIRTSNNVEILTAHIVDVLQRIAKEILSMRSISMVGIRRILSDRKIPEDLGIIEKAAEVLMMFKIKHPPTQPTPEPEPVAPPVASPVPETPTPREFFVKNKEWADFTKKIESAENLDEYLAIILSVDFIPTTHGLTSPTEIANTVRAVADKVPDRAKTKEYIEGILTGGVTTDFGILAKAVELLVEQSATTPREQVPGPVPSAPEIEPVAPIKPEPILPATPEEQEIKKETEKLSPEEREEVAKGLYNLGFRFEKGKNNFFANVFGKIFSSSENKQGRVARFCKGLQDSYINDAKNAEQKAKDAAEGKRGWRMKLQNPSLLAGSAIRTYRTITDLTGYSFASPLRYFMMISKGFTRLMKAGKEARLLNQEEVIEKTRIQDAEKAEEEARKIYERAKQKERTKNVSAEALKTAYLMEMPKDLQKRLENPSTANKFIQGIVRWDVKNAISRLSNSVGKIENDPKLSPEDKEAKIEALLRRQESNLKDWDRIVTQYGTVDGWAMAGRYLETAGKTVTAAVTIETLTLSAEKLWSTVSQMLHDHNFGLSEGLMHKIESSGRFGGKKFLTDTDLKRLHEYNADSIQNAEKTIQPGAGAETLHRGAPETGRGKIIPPEMGARVPETVPAINPDAIIHKNEGIEHAFIRQIEHNKNLATQLGWDGKEDLHHFAQGEAHRTALNYGYVDKATGQEIQVMGADKAAYELKMGNDGKIIVEEKLIGGDKEIHRAGDTFEKETEKYEYKTPQAEEIKLRPQKEYATVIEPSPETGAKPEMILESEPAATPEEIRAKLEKQYEVFEGSKNDKAYLAGESFGTGKAFGTGRVVGTGGHYYDEFYRPHNFLYYFHDLTDQQNSDLNTSPEFAHKYYDLDDKTLWRVYEFFQHHMERLLPGDQGLEDWDGVRGISAVKFLRDSEYQSDKTYKPLTDYLHKLIEATELKPKGWSPFHPAETTKTFVARALQKAAEKGILDKIQI